MDFVDIIVLIIISLLVFTLNNLSGRYKVWNIIHQSLNIIGVIIFIFFIVITISMKIKEPTASLAALCPEVIGLICNIATFWILRTEYKRLKKLEAVNDRG